MYRLRFSRFFFNPPRNTSYARFNRNDTKGSGLYILGSGALVLTGAYYFSHLETVPSSGRRRFMSLSSKEEEYMAKKAYQEVSQKFSGSFLPSYHPLSIRVKNVASKLVEVSGMKSLDWEVNVIQSPELNAFVLPGGKIFVFSGLLNVAYTDDMLAAVLGHEIAHQLARHSAEKLSVMQLVLWTRFFLSIFMDTSLIFNPALFAFLFDLPFSRSHETEADYIGLLLMSQACYDPSQSIAFWNSMANERHENVPQFASTHPSSSNRIKKLKEWLPEAWEKYHNSNCYEQIQYADMFRRSWTKW